MPGIWYDIATLVGYFSPWEDYPTGYGPASVMRDGSGYVHLQGLVQCTPYTSGSPTQNLFVLPLGLRPKKETRPYFACLGYEGGYGITRIEVSGGLTINGQADAGAVVYMGGARSWVDLSNISFLVEQ